MSFSRKSAKFTYYTYIKVRSNSKEMMQIRKIFIYLVADVAGGLVFGIPLSQCIENDRIARIAAGEVTDVGCLSRCSRHGSRTSFSSLIETPMTVTTKTEEVRKRRFNADKKFLSFFFF